MAMPTVHAAGALPDRLVFELRLDSQYPPNAGVHEAWQITGRTSSSALRTPHFIFACCLQLAAALAEQPGWDESGRHIRKGGNSQTPTCYV